MTPTNLDPLSLSPIMPVVKIAHIEQALPLANALLAGGIKTIEVTLRSDCALDAISLIARELPEMAVGAGTITTVEQFEQCQQAGALFGLSPGATLSLLEKARSSDWPFIPGVATASEIMTARDYGFNRLKFFPAEASGGCDALRGFSGPLPNIVFCPTGGINLRNLSQYLSQSNVVCVGGTWLTPADWVTNQEWDKVRSLCEESLRVAMAV